MRNCSLPYTRISIIFSLKNLNRTLNKKIKKNNKKSLYILFLELSTALEFSVSIRVPIKFLRGIDHI